MPLLQDALREAVRSGLDRLDAQILLLHTMGQPLHDRAWLLAHGLDPVDEDAMRRFHAVCAWRLTGVPVAYLTGERGFYGLELRVDHRVLDPRPDTEVLVDWSLECLRGRVRPRVLDLGTGSGAIALAIQHQRTDAVVWAVDASADALAVAQANAGRLALPIHFRQGQWLRDWPPTDGHAHEPPTRFDLIVSNPPYLAENDPHLPALRHEPREALVSGPDGLEDLREIIASAPGALAAGGWLLLEHGWDQGQAVAALLHQHRYEEVSHRTDLAGHVRCTGGRRPSNPQSTQAHETRTP